MPEKKKQSVAFQYSLSVLLDQALTTQTHQVFTTDTSYRKILMQLEIVFRGEQS